MSTETSTGPCRRRRPRVRTARRSDRAGGSPGRSVRPHPPGRAAQDGRHPRGPLDGHRHGRPGPPSSWPRSSSGALPRTRPSTTCCRSPRCRSRCCCRSSASWRRPRSGPSAPGWSPSRSSRVAAASCSPRRWAPSHCGLVVLGGRRRGRSARQPRRPAPGVGPRRRGRCRSGAGAADLRPAGRRVRAAVPQHPGRHRHPSWSCRRPGPSPRMAISSLDDVGRWLNLDSVTASAVRRRDGGRGLGPARRPPSACGCCCRWRSARGGCSHREVK